MSFEMSMTNDVESRTFWVAVNFAGMRYEMLFRKQVMSHYADTALADDHCYSASPTSPGQNGGTILTNQFVPDLLPRPRSSPVRCPNVRPAPPCGRVGEAGKT